MNAHRNWSWSYFNKCHFKVRKSKFCNYSQVYVWNRHWCFQQFQLRLSHCTPLKLQKRTSSQNYILKYLQMKDHEKIFFKDQIRMHSLLLLVSCQTEQHCLSYQAANFCQFCHVTSYLPFKWRDPNIGSWMRSSWLCKNRKLLTVKSTKQSMVIFFFSIV